MLDRILNKSNEIQLQNNLLKVKQIPHSPGCSFNIMSTINVNHQNSQADILN